MYVREADCEEPLGARRFELMPTVTGFLEIFTEMCLIWFYAEMTNIKTMRVYVLIGSKHFLF